jgi:L-ribulose-5-phosphate 3-epimerase UlaE
VARLAAAAGVEAVEWGGDVHAPSDRPEVLRQVARTSRDFGLRICSYGSYYQAGHHPDDRFASVAQAAVLLGAPRVRIWAGVLGSDQADAQDRARVTYALRSAADHAADHGLTLALEFHQGTLADTPASVRQLLDDVDRPNLRSYWQPPIGVGDDAALAGLTEMIDLVSGVHVFSWWPSHERRPLADRAALWRAVLAAFEPLGGPPDTMLEFVPDDDPQLLAREVATLAELRGRVRAV